MFPAIKVIYYYIPRYTRLYIVIIPDIPGYTLLFPFKGGGRKTAPNYNVVKTDYESYAVVYNCNQYPLIKTGEEGHVYWILCGMTL